MRGGIDPGISIFKVITRSAPLKKRDNRNVVVIRTGGEQEGQLSSTLTSAPRGSLNLATGQLFYFIRGRVNSI